MKSKLFNINNLLVTLKMIVVAFVVGVIGFVAWIIIFLLRGVELVGVSWVISAIWLVFSLFLWGYFANRWWSWK